jgi:hypothetical protein
LVGQIYLEQQQFAGKPWKVMKWKKMLFHSLKIIEFGVFLNKVIENPGI